MEMAIFLYRLDQQHGNNPSPQLAAGPAWEEEACLISDHKSNIAASLTLLLSTNSLAMKGKVQARGSSKKSNLNAFQIPFPSLALRALAKVSNMPTSETSEEKSTWTLSTAGRSIPGYSLLPEYTSEAKDGQAAQLMEEDIDMGSRSQVA
ncbi:hypothetical protein WISP_63589 [Willisornis vidua]|uniref:CE295 protein n=1 Tax=Willisornis vidua TaxID=1566151 RepID=A0ABQ9DEC0_9PASS|nr:hypothetical protein WISP_63589 [Willisornis vidua]